MLDRAAPKGVTITRDRWGVPHIVGKTDVDVAFGAGWATAQDRQLIMELLRGPGRIAALDAPGRRRLRARARGQDLRPQRRRPRRARTTRSTLVAPPGDKGRRLVKIIDAYIAGINGAYRKAGLPIRPWTRADVVAIGGLIGGLFGDGRRGRGAELGFLAKLQAKLGAERGRQVWEDLRLRDDPEAPTAVEGVFPYGQSTSELGNVVLDAGSFSAGAAAARPATGAAVERAARRGEALRDGQAARGDGPAGGLLLPRDHARARSPGRRLQRPRRCVPGDLVRRAARAGTDYAWSATSAGLDLTDQYVETLCDGSDAKYLCRGELPRDDARSTPARSAARRERPTRTRLPRDGSRPGRRVRDGRGQARRDLDAALDPRTRAALERSFFLDLSTAAVRSAKEFLSGWRRWS